MQNKYLRHKAVIRKGGRFQITSGRIALFLAGAVFAVLLILLAIEAHQDKVLNDIAMWENNDLEKKYEIG